MAIMIKFLINENTNAIAMTTLFEDCIPKVSEREKGKIADAQFPDRREKSVGKCLQCVNKQVLIKLFIAPNLESRKEGSM